MILRIHFSQFGILGWCAYAQSTAQIAVNKHHHTAEAGSPNFSPAFLGGANAWRFRSCGHLLCALHTPVCRAEKFTLAGHELHIVELLTAYVADLQEACKLMGICASGTMFPDLACLVSRDKLADPHGVYSSRTVAATRLVHLQPFFLIGGIGVRSVNTMPDCMRAL